VKLTIVLKHGFGQIKTGLSHCQDDLQQCNSVSLSLKVVART